ncbi:hypothetical protein DXG03_000526 [Asterophora parasitica]|uniref:Uncharacterized protein n=1 Tax=Asterophora parasitica TaxID=117018 RepID=A0A9P7FZX3_9AGAR|nr:hypothetical protein DXG03_000526 [Asterophora parasitica]
MAGGSSQGRKCPIVKSDNDIVDDDIGDPSEDKADELAPKKQLVKHFKKGRNSASDTPGTAAWEDDQTAPVSNATSQQSLSPNASKVQPSQSGKKIVLLLPGLTLLKVSILSDFVDPVVQALLLKTMHEYETPFCIAEWSNGTCEEASFCKKNVLDSYGAYLADIQKWASFNPAVMTNKHMKLFKRACKSAEVETTNIVPQLTGDAEDRGLTSVALHNWLHIKTFEALQLLKSTYCNGHFDASLEAQKHFDSVMEDAVIDDLSDTLLEK